MNDLIVNPQSLTHVARDRGEIERNEYETDAKLDVSAARLLRELNAEANRERGPAAAVVPAAGPRVAARAAEAAAWERALTHEQEPERWDGMS